MTDDTRKKMSEARKGEKNPNFGKRMSDEMKHKIRERNKLWKPSDEQKRRISRSMTGSKNHFFGKHHTEETKRKMSIAKFSLTSSGL